MFLVLPKLKIETSLGGTTDLFQNFNLDYAGVNQSKEELIELFTCKLWNYKEIKLTDESAIRIQLTGRLPECGGVDCKKLYHQQGYCIEIKSNFVKIAYGNKLGLNYAISTLKQLLIKSGNFYKLPNCRIIDWPSVEVRSVSTTFAWYSGYGRLGFDMQLWGYDEWVEYLNICSDFKLNQFNMCMYGYWPFELEEYPDTVLRNSPMKIWNEESRNWVKINYTHPNLSEEFLSRLFKYGKKLGFTFFAYVGLNSYNGGYSSIHKDKRMKLPKNSKFVNDFDTLCLSQPDTIQYLKTSMRKIAKLGFDGIIFEESEESCWFCNCDECTKKYLQPYGTPAEAKHAANYPLLAILYQEIRKENPNITIGLRAWREPPLEKSDEYLKKMVSSIPPDVVLFWAPGLYCGENEFQKWVNAFGKDRICARDTESNAVSACLGRLIRISRTNGLRCEEETNDQYLEEDIRQHIGSVKAGVKGINGYMFEWYGFFMHLFAHANYSWGSIMEYAEFCKYAVEAVFGANLRDDILYVLQNMLTIHESQMKIFPTEFPFARNKVEERDIQTIQQAIDRHPIIMEKLRQIKDAVDHDDKLKIYSPHFEKLIVANQRNRIIYDLSLASIRYDNAKTKEEKIKYLHKMDECNERDFDLVKRNYFDVNPVSETGTKSCMIPYHELKRVIHNELHPEAIDAEPIYLGVEALGWLWL